MKLFSSQKNVSKAIPVLGAAGLSAIALLGMAKPAKAFNIGKGSDYLVTPPGSSYDFGGVIGLVEFEGVPLGIGDSDADTVIQRQENAIFDDNNDGIVERTFVTIPIEMTRLSLKSVNSVDIGGSPFNVFVSLTPGTNSTGTMTINHNVDSDRRFIDDPNGFEGTFTSDFDVFFDATFKPVNGGTGEFTVTDTANLVNNGANWDHEPGQDPILVTGPLGNQDANCHVGAVSSGVPPCDDTDFFTSRAMHGPDDIHITEPSQCDGDCTKPVPEPLTILGSVTALGVGGLLKRESSRKRKQMSKA